MEELIKEIELTGYLTDKKIGSIFHSKYPKIYNKIIDITKDIEKTYVVNTTLRSRVIFLLKYDCDIKKLKYDNIWLTFDRKKDDFIKKTVNSAKKGWENNISYLKNVEILSLDETINQVKLLTDNDIFGRSKNRIMLSNNPALFKSIEYYSKDLDLLNKPSKKFPSKIIFIRDYEGKIDQLRCQICGKNYCLYNETKHKFNNVCKKCYHKSVPKYPQKEWFIITYGKEWMKFYNEDRDKIKEYQVNSEKWFVKKYGEEKGKELRSEYIQNRVDNIIQLKDNGVSKISQELFWKIYNKIPNKINCYFSDLNKELIIREDDTIYFPDFVYNNKIIEYDGVYWHDDEKDKKRNDFYLKMGYELFIVTSDDFNRNKKDDNIIDKCVSFLLDET